MANDGVVFNHLPAIIEALRQGAAVGVRNAAKEVRQAATNNVPVDTGFLRATVYQVTSDASSYWQATSQASSIDEFRQFTPQVDPPDDDQTAIVAYAASYAVPVHDGARSMPARPWLAEAATGVNVAEHVAQAISDAINGAARGGKS